MPEPIRRDVTPVSAPARLGEASNEATHALFYGLIDPVIVASPAEFAFDGAIPRDDAEAMWIWVRRDVAGDLVDPRVAAPAPEEATTVLAPELLRRIRAALDRAGQSAETQRALRTQLASEAAWDRMPTLINALRCVPLLGKAQAFGRAVNGIQDEPALVRALGTMPFQDAGVAAILMMAALAEVVQPGRLVVAATRILGETNEIGLQRGGFGPMVDAMLAHAQNCIPALKRQGPFADIDLVCRAIERFHRLTRGIVSNLELYHSSRWSLTIAGLTKTISARLEPRLRDIMPDLNQALRRAREGQDRLDSDSVFAALNGLYVLETVRDCRDSLAVNEVFEQTWSHTGQALEMYLSRSMEALRDNPGDQVVAGRLDAGIKMAEIRFGIEYADVLRRARDGVERKMAF